MTYLKAKRAVLKLMPEVGERYFDNSASKTCTVKQVKAEQEFMTVDLVYDKPDPPRVLSGSGTLAQTVGIGFSANAWWESLQSGRLRRIRK